MSNEVSINMPFPKAAPRKPLQVNHRFVNLLAGGTVTAIFGATALVMYAFFYDEVKAAFDPNDPAKLLQKALEEEREENFRALVISGAESYKDSKLAPIYEERLWAKRQYEESIPRGVKILAKQVGSLEDVQPGQYGHVIITKYVPKESAKPDPKPAAS